MGDNTFEYKLVVTEIKQYHNGPGHLFAENILADITCPFTIFVDSSGTVKDFYNIEILYPHSFPRTTMNDCH